MVDFKAKSGFAGGAGAGNWGFLIFAIFLLIIFSFGFFGGSI